MDNEVKESKVVQLRIDDIIPNRFQPREIFDENGLSELADSIKEHGVIQPIIVRPFGDKYELIAGERRTKASSLAGLTTIPAIVRNMDDNESAKISLLENLQRRNLSAIEEARTYKRILELDNMTQDQLAKSLGKSQPMVANKLRLLALPEEIQDALIKNQISERHARSLLNVKPKEKQLMFLERIKKERLTVRELDSEIKKMQSEESESSDQPKERKEEENMNNGMPNGNMGFNDFNNNYRSNFGNMGLNDYQSSINNGMFNNLPNMNSSQNQGNQNQFISNVAPNNDFANVDNFNNNATNNNSFNDNSFMSMGNQNQNQNGNNMASLGQMLDGGTNNQMVNNFNNNNDNNQTNGSNQFISQIKDNSERTQENQFLPNFNSPSEGEFNNQVNFGTNDNFTNNGFDNNNFQEFESINGNNMNNFPTPSFGNSNNNQNQSPNNNFGPIEDFSFPTPQTSNFPSGFPLNGGHQGGLFNEPLNIVNVPNNNNIDTNEQNQTSNGNSTPHFPPFEEKKQEEEPSQNQNDEITTSRDYEVEGETTGEDPSLSKPQVEEEKTEEPQEESKEEKEPETKKEYIQLDPVTTIFDTRGAVLELKKTTDRIKENKIKIDTEEIEFDDYYQITIKIKK